MEPSTRTRDSTQKNDDQLVPSSTSGSGKWNGRNAAVKRIMRELKEIHESENPDIEASALESNIFEWFFAIRGAWGTEFERGIYHGRILMPADYPFNPPAFVMMTPSGRFETGKKICLSISSFHPESWQPSWNVESALLALIAFMQTPGNGAIGSMDSSAEDRKEMALESRVKGPPCVQAGCPDRQEIIDQIHEKMVSNEDASSVLYISQTSASTAPNDDDGNDDGTREEEEEGQEQEVSPAEPPTITTTTTTTTTASSSHSDSVSSFLMACIVAIVVVFVLRKVVVIALYGGRQRNVFSHEYDGANLVDHSIEL